MFVSKQLKEKNIAEYLIYMWQIEDLIRANGCDIEKIKSTIIAPYPLTEEQKAELTQWYMDLIEMMRHEGIMEKGHLQINKNIITWLTDLHLQYCVPLSFLIIILLIIKYCPILWSYALKVRIKRSLSWKRVLRRFMVSYC